MIKQIITLILLFILVSCGGNKNEENDNIVVKEMNDNNPTTKNGKIEENQTTSGEIGEEIMQRGKDIYETYCLMCHQTNGSGVPSTFPPLTETKHVLGSKENLIKIILNGQKGEIEVLGEIYDGEMPAQDFLSNKQIADVLTYVRNSFGNNATPISPEEVKEVRNR